MAIRFYSRSETFSELSNFAPFGVEIDGAWWPTVEHFYQASKFADEELRRKIRKAEKPPIAKSLAEKHRDAVRADWRDVRDAVMERALRSKVATHPEIRVLLLSAGDEELIEEAPDKYWGVGKDGSGENALGRLWMRLRDELRAGGSP